MKHIINIILFWILSLSFGITATVTTDLKSGYNLVNLEEASLETIVSSIGFNNLISIQGTSQGSAYKKQYIDDNKAFLNTFSKAEKAMGYWVNIKTDISMVLEKALYSGTQTISLVSGWNLFAPLEDTSIEDVVTQLGINNLQVIQGAKQNSAYKKQYIDDNKAFLNTLTTLEKEQGYWVNLTTSSDISFVFELEQIALDNADNEVIITKVINNITYTIKLYASNSPTSTTSQSTLPSYGTLLGETVVMYINETYGLDTQFQAKYYDASGQLLGMSEIVNSADGYIHFDELKAINTPTIPASRPFISTWKTDNSGGSEDNQIEIPTNNSYDYNYKVDWGDGSFDENVTGTIKHTYNTVGTYTIKITGEFPSFLMGVYSPRYSYMDENPPDRDKLLSIDQWGDIEWKSMSYAFTNCDNIRIQAIDAPNLSNVNSMEGMFEYSRFNDDINHWDVSSVSNMSRMFSYTNVFNQHLNTWNVSNVNNMFRMFDGASSFNQPLNAWDVSSVTNMTAMFYAASSFNQPINSWDVSNVTKMCSGFSYPSGPSRAGFWGIFSYATSFNQPLDNWNILGVTDMAGMFYQATSFNQSLEKWDISNVRNMHGMFGGASTFNQPLNNWDVSNVSSIIWMFSGASAFNQPLSDWNISNISDMEYILNETNLSTENYDNILISWSQQSLQSNVEFDASPIKYSSNALTARQSIIDNYGWTITDGGMVEEPNTVPTANAGEDKSIELAQSLVLTASATDVDGTISSYVWTEGITQLSTSQSFSYTPTTIGTHTLILTVTDNDGGMTTSTILITVVGVQKPFITTWKTDNEGVTSDNQIKIPTNTSYTYNYTVDWGDGSIDKNVTDDKIHTYATVGTYTVKISGDFPNFYMYGTDRDNQKLLTVEQWGDIEWKSMSDTFNKCSNFIMPATDSPNLSNVTNMTSMFFGASNFNQPIEHWDVSNVTRMILTFYEASSFNQSLNNWDVSNVTNMANMFGAFTRSLSFNQPLNNWDVSNVTDMRDMFRSAISFNQPLNNWDVSNVSKMGRIFYNLNFRT